MSTKQPHKAVRPSGKKGRPGSDERHYIDQVEAALAALEASEKRANASEDQLAAANKKLAAQTLYQTKIEAEIARLVAMVEAGRVREKRQRIVERISIQLAGMMSDYDYGELKPVDLAHPNILKNKIGKFEILVGADDTVKLVITPSSGRHSGKFYAISFPISYPNEGLTTHAALAIKGYLDLPANTKLPDRVEEELDCPISASNEPTSFYTF